MNEGDINQLISLLTSIDAKLDTLTDIEARLESIENDINEIKMEISGFSHEGKAYPGRLENMEGSLSEIESELSSMAMTLNSIESNTQS